MPASRSARTRRGLNVALNEKQIPPAGGNVARVRNADVSGALDAALAEVDDSKLAGRFQDVCKAMNKTVPWGTMWVSKRYGVVSTKLKDMVWLPGPRRRPLRPEGPELVHHALIGRLRRLLYRGRAAQFRTETGSRHEPLHPAPHRYRPRHARGAQHAGLRPAAPRARRSGRRVYRSVGADVLDRNGEPRARGSVSTSPCRCNTSPG